MALLRRALFFAESSDLAQSKIIVDKRHIEPSVGAWADIIELEDLHLVGTKHLFEGKQFVLGDLACTPRAAHYVTGDKHGADHGSPAVCGD